MEWTVVGVIVTLVGLGAAIVPPIIKLNTSIVKLTDSNDRLSEKLTSMETSNTSEHRRIWTAVDKNHGHINDHETRISVLEDRERNEVL